MLFKDAIYVTSLALLVASSPTQTSKGLDFVDSFEGAAAAGITPAPQPRDEASAEAISPTTWAPPSTMTQALTEVWNHEMATYNNGNALGFKNYGYDVSVI
jgi:hypothetical protein